MKWISVKDRLPTQRSVIVAYRFGVGEANFAMDRFFIPNTWTDEFPDVTHWMPLPDPPEDL